MFIFTLLEHLRFGEVLSVVGYKRLEKSVYLIRTKSP